MTDVVLQQEIRSLTILTLMYGDPKLITNLYFLKFQDLECLALYFLSNARLLQKTLVYFF